MRFSKRGKLRFQFGDFVFLLSFLTVLSSALLVWGGYRILRAEFPDVSLLKTQYPVVRYQGRNKPPLVTLQKRVPCDWVTLGQVSRVAVGAIIVSEDWAFFQHDGFDANQIKEAIQDDIQAGRFVRGASTITQQMIKNVFLTHEKSLWRKFKELVLAVSVERNVSKRKILETYLNIAEWGEGIYGIREAAQHYFRKSPAELSAKEGAFLAMLLPSPKRYSQSFKDRQLTDYARVTVRSILNKMVQAQYISEEERDRQANLPFSFELVPGTAL